MMPGFKESGQHRDAIHIERFPASAVVPTRNRVAPMARLLTSLSRQSFQPTELIVIDASDGDETLHLLERRASQLACKLSYERADTPGAAAQRNQGVAAATQPFVLFMDDDILLEPDCLLRLWKAIQGDARLGAVNAMITNQRYTPPGRISRSVFRLLNGNPEESYAGKCIGPAFNLLPEDRDDLPEVVGTEWLNTTCTLYRRDAFPSPPFDAHFSGYSMMEDLTLSLRIARNWRLANARTARIFHDSQDSDEKRDITAMARMELLNRYYVMRHVLGRDSISDYARFVFLQLFTVASSLRTLKGSRRLPKVMLGKWLAIQDIIRDLRQERQRKTA